MDGDKYYYNKGEKLPYMTNNQNDYKYYNIYDKKGRLIGKLLKNDNKVSFTEYEYSYGTTN